MNWFRKTLAALALGGGLTFLVAQGVTIPGLPVNPSPSGSDMILSWHSGSTVQAPISAYNTVFVDQTSNQTIGGVKTFTGAVSVGGALSLPGVSPTALPSVCLGLNGAFSTQYYPCTTGTVTTVSVDTVNFTGGGAGPTPTAIALAVPSPTACPSAMVGINAANRLWTVAGGCPAFTGQSKAAFTIVAGVSATASPGLFTQPIPLSPDYVSPTVDSASFYCTTAGFGASQTVAQFYESTPGPTGSPTLSTANPVGSPIPLPTGTSQAVFVTFTPVPLPTNAVAGAPTYLFVGIQTISGTPCSGTLSFTLNGLQRLIP